MLLQLTISGVLMKRFHVHVAVNDLDKSIRFYSTVFGSQPTVVKSDYAKWMIEDPRINFAISSRGAEAGVNHLGLQVDSDEELQAMRDQLVAADSGIVEETGANCCYAKSDKYWVTDPQGIAWETYHTLGSIPMFGADSQSKEAASCCAPPAAVVSTRIPVKAQGSCC
jgi:catechol 2,3-dioxygenase-like lactoylglutathione lyase family enzyme